MAFGYYSSGYFFIPPRVYIHGFLVVRGKILSIDDSLKINYFMFNLRSLKNKGGEKND